MRKILITVILTLLAACSSGPRPASSASDVIPPGSKLVLKQSLTIPPNAGRVYIQYGKVVTPNRKDNFYAHCWFLSWKVLDTAQVISPDTFTIVRTAHLEDIVSRRPFGNPPLRKVRNFVGTSNDGGPMALVYTTKMTLHSDTQPDIRHFVCSHWEDPMDANHLTVDEIRKVLGNIAELEINPGH